MARRKIKRQKTERNESDGAYILKLVLYFFLGSLWVRIGTSDSSTFELALPLGLLVGLVFASHEHFQVDRKIEYAVLFISTVLSYYIPVGLIV